MGTNGRPSGLAQAHEAARNTERELSAVDLRMLRGSLYRAVKAAQDQARATVSATHRALLEESDAAEARARDLAAAARLVQAADRSASLV